MPENACFRLDHYSRFGKMQKGNGDIVYQSSQKNSGVPRTSCGLEIHVCVNTPLGTGENARLSSRKKQECSTGTHSRDLPRNNLKISGVPVEGTVSWPVKGSSVADPFWVTLSPS